MPRCVENRVEARGRPPRAAAPAPPKCALRPADRLRAPMTQPKNALRHFFSRSLLL